MIIATASDLTKRRFLFVLLPLFVALAGFSTLLGIKDNYHVEYGALFLAVSGVYSAMPVIVCWFNSNCCKPIPLVIPIEIELIHVS